MNLNYPTFTYVYFGKKRETVIIVKRPWSTSATNFHMSMIFTFVVGANGPEF